jgi:hypothetical protein
MNFRLTNVKGAISIILIIVWMIFLNIYNRQFVCGSCNMVVQCKDFSYLAPVHLFCVCCFSIGNLIILWLIILAPGILTYLIWSLFEKKYIPNVKKRK